MSGDTQRQAGTYRNLRAARAEPLTVSYLASWVLYIFQTCNFSAYLRTTSHSPVKTWQQLTIARFATFSQLFTRRFEQLRKLLVEFAETKIEQIRPVMYTADPHSLWTETVGISKFPDKPITTTLRLSCLVSKNRDATLWSVIGFPPPPSPPRPFN